MTAPIRDRAWQYAKAEQHREGYLREKWDALYPGWRDKPQRKAENVRPLKAKGKS